MVWKEFRILQKIHPKADLYFMRLAVVAGVLLILQILVQLTTAIDLLR
jgi:hypothetical protein